MAIDDILSSVLRLREANTLAEWRLWEYKSFNMHRGVLQWRPSQPVASCADLSAVVRQRVIADFRRSWWRGFAFGAMVELSELPKDIAAIDSCIDTRAHSKGTWQWLIVTCPNDNAVIGVHTWIEGYLAPIYRALLSHFESIGCCTGSFKKEKDRLMQFLKTVQKLRGRSLGKEFTPWQPTQQ